MACNGGRTLDAAAADCGTGADATKLPPGEPADVEAHPDIPDTLAALASLSLARREGQEEGDARFAMLETIRAYAMEQLEANGEVEALPRRHAPCFLELAEAAELELTDPKQVAWLIRLEREHANLRAALRRLRHRGDGERQGPRLAAACGFPS